MTPKYPAQTFTNIDPSKWARVIDAIKKETGITISTSTGVASGKGITINWTYSPDTETLVVDLVDRKFYDPSEQTIDQKIATLIADA
jgi:hypothetical protein